MKLPEIVRSSACASALWVLCGSLPAVAGEIHVSPSAPAGGSGTAEKPFATLEEARLAAQRQKDGDVTVLLGGGHYLAPEGFLFTGLDSGTSERRVTYRSKPGERARFSSGIVVPPDALKPVTDEAIRQRFPEAVRDRVRQVALGDFGISVEKFKDTFRGLEMLEVYADGKRQPLSRWPGNGKYARIEKVTDNGISGGKAGTFVYRGEAPGRWTQAVEEGLWLRGFWRVPWTIEAIRVESINPDEKSISLAAAIPGGIGSKYHRAANNGSGPGSGDEPWEAINLLEEMDSDGEWAVRFATNTLYLLPPEGVGELLITANRKPVIQLDGVSHFSLENVDVDGGLGDGIQVREGENVLVAGCKVSNVARTGIAVDGGKDHVVLSNDTTHTGLSGISYLGGDRVTLTPANHRILNNIVSHAGEFFPAPGIDGGLRIGAVAVGNLVAHNRIHDSANSGVVYAGNDNIFEYNDIYRIGLGSSDLGCFYTTGGWTSRGNVVRYNMVHHAMNGNAFYVDDGDSGDLFHGNIAYKTESGGFIGGGHDQIFRNNIMVECTRAMHLDARGVARGYTVNDRRLRGDLDAMPYKTPPWSEKYPELVNILDIQPERPSGIVIEKNLFVACETGVRKSNRESEFGTVLIEGNMASEDLGMFVNPAELDFRLKPDAEVFRQIPGFEQVPMEKIGLYADAYRPEVPARNMELLRTGNTDAGFDSQTDVDASNRK